MKIDMIVVDLDGTVLHKDESISLFTIETLRMYQLKGVKIVIATSRTEASAEKYCNLLKPDAVILYGGAIAFVGKHTIHEARIEANEAYRYIHKCLNMNCVDYIRVSGEREDFSNNPNLDCKEMEFGHYKKTTFDQISIQAVNKITICSKNIEEIKKTFENDKMCNLTVSYAGVNFHKLTHKNATKEFALQKIMSYFRIKSQNIIAFGDDMSDINMLSMCGIGVAMGNAIVDVKLMANQICEANEKDGVANFLIRNFMVL